MAEGFGLRDLGCRDGCGSCGALRDTSGIGRALLQVCGSSTGPWEGFNPLVLLFGVWYRLGTVPSALSVPGALSLMLSLVL